MGDRGERKKEKDSNLNGKGDLIVFD